jgi:hypothetical protein
MADWNPVSGLLCDAETEDNLESLKFPVGQKRDIQLIRRRISLLNLIVMS